MWRAFKDVCPHRLVPLSEGHIEDASVLQCAYHGCWEFNENGTCTKIPQLGDVQDPVIVQNPQSCATSYPTRIAQGLLWIFPFPGESTSKQAKPLALITELYDPDSVDATSFFFRDMPYSWEILVENLCDPSHIPFAHHNIIRTANRYNVDMIDMEIVEETQFGFKSKKLLIRMGKGGMM